MAVLDSLRALVGNVAARLLPIWQTPLAAPAPTACKSDQLDVREVALEQLRDYLASIDIALPDGRTFRLPKEDVLIAAADDPGGNGDMQLPAIGMSGSPAETEQWTPDIDDDSLGIRGPGTALAWTGNYSERVIVELWTESEPQRRAVLRAMKVAFNPAEQTSTLILESQRYYGLGIRYSLFSVQVVEDAEAVRNRWRALLVLDIDAPEVQLVFMNRLQPRVRTVVEDPLGGD